MAIADLQRRQTEVGRVRLGQKVKTASGKERPARLETFRFTSPSKRLIEAIAELYGGQVQEWTPPRGAAEWEVITDAASVPVVVPPQDVDSSQFYELWSAGGVQRRCTGVRELISDQPCVCDPANRDCSLHTRVNLMLRDVPGIGVWRLDVGSYYAAMELPGMVQLLSRANGMVPALLELRQRTVTRDGQTKHFVVPVLHVEDFTPGQLISGQVTAMAIDAGPERQAIAATPAGEPEPEDGKGPMSATPEVIDGIRQMIADAPNEPELRAVWRGLGDSGITVAPDVKAELTQLFWARLKTVRDEAKGVPAEPVQEPDKTAAWTAALAAAAGRGWSTSDASQRFREEFGHDVTQATGSELARFTDLIKDGAFA